MKDRKYELIEDKLLDYVEDFVHVDDWVPFELNWKYFRLGYDQMDYVKDRSASKKRYAHSYIANEHLRTHDYIEETNDWEVEEFLNKYPKFKPLYHINTEYEYGGWKNKYQKKSNIFYRMFRNIFSF